MTNFKDKSCRHSGRQLQIFWLMMVSPYKTIKYDFFYLCITGFIYEEKKKQWNIKQNI
jgi:hypothetical protein